MLMISKFHLLYRKQEPLFETKLDKLLGILLHNFQEKIRIGLEITHKTNFNRMWIKANFSKSNQFFCNKLFFVFKNAF